MTKRSTTSTTCPICETPGIGDPACCDHAGTPYELEELSDAEFIQQYGMISRTGEVRVPPTYSGPGYPEPSDGPEACPDCGRKIRWNEIAGQWEHSDAVCPRCDVAHEGDCDA